MNANARGFRVIQYDDMITTALLRDDYRRDGVVGPIDVLPLEEATEMKEAFARDFLDQSSPILADPSSSEIPLQPQYHQANDQWFKTHLFVPWVNRIVRHPNLVKAVQEVLQSSDIRCWSSDFNVRHAGENAMVAPHQDATFAGLYPPEQVVTAWVALSDPVTLQEGGLFFFRGSHLLGQLPHAVDGEDNIETQRIVTSINGKEHETKMRNVLSRRQRCALPGTNSESTAIALRAGQATLHHFYTVHTSGPNRSSDPRIGLAIRYMTAAVRRCHVRVPEMITWISGNREITHTDCFAWEPILPEHPTANDVERGTKAHQEAMEREKTNYFSAPFI
jgi:non-haem Fe2+, alpha-ketoglutarate-dependent halogenase